MRRHRPDGLPGIYLRLSYEDLFPGRRATISDLLHLYSTFDRDTLVGVLAEFNIILGQEPAGLNRSTELTLLRIIMPPALYQRVEEMFSNGHRHKFLDRLVLLSAIQCALATEGGATLERSDDELMNDISQLMLKQSSLLESDYFERRKGTKDESERGDNGRAALFRSMLFSFSDDFAASLARHWLMLTRGVAEVERKFPKETSVDVTALFQELFGIQPLDIIGTGVAIRHHYMMEPSKLLRSGNELYLNEAFFSKIPTQVQRDACRKVLEYLAATWDEHIEAAKASFGDSSGNSYRLSFIFDHPMVSLPDGRYFPLDLHYVQERLSNGLFWSVHNELCKRGRTGEARAFKGTFARAFEWYVSHLMAEHSQQHDRAGLWLDWRGDIPAQSGVRIPDAILREGNVLLFLEFTTMSLRPATVIEGDPNKLSAALRQFWFGRDSQGDGGKLVQVCSAVEAFRRGQLRLKGVNAPDIIDVYPIVVTLRPLPQHEALWPWYARLIEQCPPRWEHLRPLMLRTTFVTIAELELLLGLKEDGIDVSSILNRRKTSGRTRACIVDFCNSVGQPLARPQLVTDWIHQALNAAHSQLFAGACKEEE